MIGAVGFTIGLGAVSNGSIINVGVSNGYRREPHINQQTDVAMSNSVDPYFLHRLQYSRPVMKVSRPPSAWK